MPSHVPRLTIAGYCNSTVCFSAQVVRYGTELGLFWLCRAAEFSAQSVIRHRYIDAQVKRNQSLCFPVNSRAVFVSRARGNTPTHIPTNPDIWL